ncbi:MAG: universal stress protein [Candidatus Promineifilaceae bacterium]
MFKRVLVPLDGSMLAESALEPALHLAEQTAGTVYLIRVPVFMDSGVQSTPEYDRGWAADNNTVPEYEDTTAYLRETRNRIARRGVTVRTVVGEGEPANAINNAAVDRNADLIVIASHARKGVSRLLLGSVAGKVIGRAQIPVMLVRKAQLYKHILVTLDGSEVAERILEPALALAEGLNCRITFFEVEDPGEDDLASPRLNYLDEIAARYSDRDIQVTTVLEKGAVANTIMSFAASNDVDLVAMSTSGRTGLQKLIFGSVTEKVMGESDSAMLIVRPAGGDTS